MNPAFFCAPFSLSLHAGSLEIFGAAEEGTFLGKNDAAGRSIIPACAFGAGEEEEEEEGEFLACCKGKGRYAGSLAAAHGTRSSSNQVTCRLERRDEADVIQTAGVLSWICLRKGESMK